MDNKLVKVLEKVNNNFSKRAYSSNGNKEEPFFHIYEESKFVEFYGEFKDKARSMKELEPLFNYMNEYGYNSNLD